MSNISFFYIYRDAGNNKSCGLEVFPNTKRTAAKTLSKKIESFLEEGVYFIAEQVGIKPVYFEIVDPEIDHGFHEFTGCEAVDVPITQNRDISEFLEMLKSIGAQGWKVENERLFS